MILKPSRSLLFAALGAALSAALMAGSVRATVVSANIGLGPPNNLGPPNPSNTGTFTGTIGLGSGSQLSLGASAISGNYKEHLGSGIFSTNVNIGFSASNQTATLSSSGTTLSTTNASGNTNLSFDNVTPGTPTTVNSFSALLSDSQSAGVTINSGGISMSTSVGTFTLTPTFTGTISNVTFTSSGAAAVSGGDGGAAAIPGTYGVTIGGSVTGSLSVLGIPISIGTLATLPPSIVTFSGVLPAVVTTSDTGVPNPVGFETTLNPNNMLADFQAALSGLNITFPFTTSLSTNENFSVGSSSSGVTSIKIQNTSLTANLVLSGLSYNLSGVAPGVLVPEPSSMALGALALVGLVGFAARRRKVG